MLTNKDLYIILTNYRFSIGHTSFRGYNVNIGLLQHRVIGLMTRYDRPTANLLSACMWPQRKINEERNWKWNRL